MTGGHKSGRKSRLYPPLYTPPCNSPSCFFFLQRIPPVLATLEDPMDQDGGADETKGCAFCGGLGHRIATCPKLEAHRMKQIMGGGRDELAGSRSGGGGTDW